MTGCISRSGPLDCEVALDADPALARCRGQVQDDGDERSRWRIRLRRLEARVVPFGLDELVSVRREFAN